MTFHWHSVPKRPRCNPIRAIINCLQLKRRKINFETLLFYPIFKAVFISQKK